MIMGSIYDFFNYDLNVIHNIFEDNIGNSADDIGSFSPHYT